MPFTFMYHNDNSQGYIRMAGGTAPSRQYRHPVYFVLDPKFIAGQQLILTKNGVILFFGDIPASCLHLQEQLPTLACPVLRPGRGHMLPPSFTGGTWPADVSYGHVRREKGAGFVAGGEIPTNVFFFFFLGGFEAEASRECPCNIRALTV